MAPYKVKQVTVKITVDGKPYYVRGKTKKEAREKAAIRKHELEQGLGVLSDNPSVKAWAAKWLLIYKKPVVNPRQYSDIEGVVKNYITGESRSYEKEVEDSKGNKRIVTIVPKIQMLKDENGNEIAPPTIGDKKVRAVKHTDLKKILNYMAESGKSDSYIKKTRDIICQIFKAARQEGYIIKDPAEGLQAPKGAQKQVRRAITEKERALTLKVAEYNRGGLFVLIILFCGLRPGEVAALKWSDIDMKARIINVHQAVKAEGRTSDPKTPAGIRQVPIPEYLYERLETIKHGPWDLVCTTTTGKKHTKSTINDLWKSFARDLNIAAGCKVFRNQVQAPFFVNDLTLYCYRHTYGTDLQAAGVPINVAKELMGHENISTTANIYTHGSKDAFADAADKIEAFQGSKVAPKVAP